MATLAKLTSLSTQSLSLLLERQRLQSLSAGPDGSSLHLSQITRNLNQLRTGVLELEEKDGNTEAVRLLKSQYERMRGMLGHEAEAAGIQRSVLVCQCTDIGGLTVVGLRPQSTTDAAGYDVPQPCRIIFVTSVVQLADTPICAACITRDTAGRGKLRSVYRRPRSGLPHA